MTTDRKLKTGLVLAVALTITGCATTTGQQHRADVYRAGQVNQAQEAKVIRILAVMPAQIEVDNKEAQRNAQVVGAIAGAILGTAATRNTNRVGATTGAVGGAAIGAGAGALVPGKVLVDGVSITYIHDKRTLNSAQVGRLCEFAPGDAVLISTTANETRIQPNQQCPAEKQG